ncbi:hypothetical protein [Gimesia fumaroli]|jgi:hypothetical protein|uniref:hypothetical protein n=1 Tax=Gimesia fumaroli TaxID=2527976 RepID=UPI0011A95CA0|nr:hypothetical protein [Gimesia fumaroli]
MFRQTITCVPASGEIYAVAGLKAGNSEAVTLDRQAANTVPPEAEHKSIFCYFKSSVGELVKIDL